MWFGNKDSKINILVTVPNTGWISDAVTLTCMQIVASEHRFKGTIVLPKAKPLENNQHQIIKQFLAGDYDYWISIDSDNPPMRNPLDLVLYNKDIIGCPTPIWFWDGTKPGERPIYWSAYDKCGNAYKEHPTKEGLQRVDAIGGGCFCIARRVFERPEMQHGAFLRQVDASGITCKGNDLSFCERATKCDFEIYAHFGYPCKHIVELELTAVSLAFQGVIESCQKAT